MDPILSDLRVVNISKVLSAALLISASCVHAGGVQELESIVVTGNAALPGLAVDSATEGIVTASHLSTRPLLRVGEMLETVPGFIATQHSGNGKANQYFLRGFNLDHGTDAALFLNGMPLNMGSHAHGQGYADINFVIPELIEQIAYRKGPYSAQDGNFASAGTMRLDYASRVDAPFLRWTLGSGHYQRMVAAGSRAMAAGNLLAGIEIAGNDGPWVVPENLRKANGLLRYSSGTQNDNWHATLMAYQSRWTATDQIPLRAVAAGLIDRFGAVDASDGGRARRASLSLERTASHETGSTRANAFFVDSTLALFSNFTYALDRLDTGDQFSQTEARKVMGAGLTHTAQMRLFAREVEATFGANIRHDRLSPVALADTENRTSLAFRRKDRISETNLSGFAELALPLMPLVRATAGARIEHLRGQVRNELTGVSANVNDTFVLPKLSFAFGPWSGGALFANFGDGLHSNDLRGAAAQSDDAGFRPTPLVRTRGAEIGLRKHFDKSLQTSVSLWTLRSASELVYIGDAGTTEPNGASRRSGIEWASYWSPNPNTIVDVDFAWSRARFVQDPDGAGRYVPGAVDRTASVSASHTIGAVTAGARWRYIGPRALSNDNTERAASSSLVSARLAYVWNRHASVELEGFNLFNRKANDIEYFYESRLRNESTSVADRHIHPAEPRSVRLSARLTW